MATYAETILATSGLLAYWTLDETSSVFVDQVGGFNLTATGTQTRGTPGLFPNSSFCTDLNGTTGKCDRTTAGTSELAAGTAFSVECWVRPDVGATRMAIFSRGGSTAATEQILFGTEAAGTWEAYVSNGTSYVGVSSIGSWTSGNVYHIVETWATPTGLLYVNGVNISGAGFSVATPVASPSNILTFGARGGTTQWWNGAIDDCSFYNRALTGGEVAAHYAAGTPPVVLTPSFQAIPFMR